MQLKTTLSTIRIHHHHHHLGKSHVFNDSCMMQLLNASHFLPLQFRLQLLNEMSLKSIDSLYTQKIYNSNNMFEENKKRVFRTSMIIMFWKL